MLSKDLEKTLNNSFKVARSKRHEFMTVEHLLLALLDNDIAADVLVACGANVKELQGDLCDFVDSTTPLIPEVGDEAGLTWKSCGASYEVSAIAAVVLADVCPRTLTYQ